MTTMSVRACHVFVLADKSGVIVHGGAVLKLCVHLYVESDEISGCLWTRHLQWMAA